MDFFSTIEQRYSHKENYLPDPVPLRDLEVIAQAGIAAPNGANAQTVRLVLMPDRAALQPLCDASPTNGLQTAPAAIAVLTDSSVPQNPLNFNKEDYAAAATQMLLAATALGYASVWLDSPYFDEANEKAARAALNASDNYRLWAVLPIGKPDGPGSRRDKLPFEARVSYGKMDK